MRLGSQWERIGEWLERKRRSRGVPPVNGKVSSSVILKSKKSCGAFELVF